MLQACKSSVVSPWFVHREKLRSVHSPYTCTGALAQKQLNTPGCTCSHNFLLWLSLNKCCAEPINLTMASFCWQWRLWQGLHGPEREKVNFFWNSLIPLICSFSLNICQLQTPVINISLHCCGSWSLSANWAISIVSGSFINSTIQLWLTWD